MKKTLSIVLSLVMLLSTIAGINLTAYASSGSCGSGVYWEYSEDNDTLRIYGSGAMTNDDYVSYDYSIKNYCEKIVIENGVTSICDNAFDWFDDLYSVTIPKTVTSIGEEAFCGCLSLTSITIPSNVKNGRWCF